MKITELPDTQHNQQISENVMSNGNGHAAPVDSATVDAHDEAVSAAFSSILAAHEENYEELMDSFIQLTPGLYNKHLGHSCMSQVTLYKELYCHSLLYLILIFF